MSRKRRRRGNRDPERQDRGLVTGRGRARANEMGRAALLCGCAGTQPALCAGDSPHFTLFPKLGLHKCLLAPVCARSRHRRDRCERNGLGGRRTALLPQRDTWRFRYILTRLAPLVLVKPPAEGAPVRQPLVHEGIEPGAVVVNSEMCVFVGNDVLDQVAWNAGEFGVVGDVAVTPMAAPPERLHLADLPRDPFLSHTSRPRCVQFAEERPQGFPPLSP